MKDINNSKKLFNEFEIQISSIKNYKEVSIDAIINILSLASMLYDVDKISNIVINKISILLKNLQKTDLNKILVNLNKSLSKLPNDKKLSYYNDIGLIFLKGDIKTSNILEELKSNDENHLIKTLLLLPSLKKADNITVSEVFKMLNHSNKLIRSQASTTLIILSENNKKIIDEITNIIEQEKHNPNIIELTEQLIKLEKTQNKPFAIAKVLKNKDEKLIEKINNTTIKTTTKSTTVKINTNNKQHKKKTFVFAKNEIIKDKNKNIDTIVEQFENSNIFTSIFNELTMNGEMHKDLYCKLLAHSNRDIRVNTTIELGKQENADENVIFALSNVVCSNYSWANHTRNYAKQSLVKIGKKNSNIVDSIYKSYKNNSNSKHLLDLAKVIFELGEYHYNKLEIIYELTIDKNSDISSAAIIALKKISDIIKNDSKHYQSNEKNYELCYYLHNNIYKILNYCQQDNFDLTNCLKLDILGIIGKNNKHIINFLYKNLNNKSSSLSFCATRDLIKLGYVEDKTINNLYELLNTKEKYNKYRLDYLAIQILIKLDKFDKKIKIKLHELLDCDDADIKLYALNTLIQLNHTDDKILKVTHKLLENQDFKISNFSIDAITKLSKKDKKIISILKEDINRKFRKSNINEAKFSICALIEIGKSSEESEYILCSYLNVDNKNLQYYAAKNISKLKNIHNAKYMIEKILKSLYYKTKHSHPLDNNKKYEYIKKETDISTRRAKITALISVCKNSDEAINILYDKLALHGDYNKYILEVLEKVDKKHINIINLLSNVNSEDVNIKIGVAIELAKFEQDNDKIIEAFGILLQDKNKDVSKYAAKSIIQLCKTSAKAIIYVFNNYKIHPLLTKFVSNSENNIKIANFFGQVGESNIKNINNEAIKVICLLLTNTDNSVNAKAIEVVNNIYKAHLKSDEKSLLINFVGNIFSRVLTHSLISDSKNIYYLSNNKVLNEIAKLIIKLDKNKIIRIIYRQINDYFKFSYYTKSLMDFTQSIFKKNMDLLPIALLTTLKSKKIDFSIAIFKLLELAKLNSLYLTNNQGANMLNDDHEKNINQESIKTIFKRIAIGNDILKIENNKEKYGIVLLGNTDAGKTSLGYGFENELKAIPSPIIKNTNIVIPKKPYANNQFNNKKIGLIPRSETTVPNKFSPEGISGVIVWDSPGLNDTDIKKEVPNSFYTKKLFDTPNLKFVLVVPAHDIFGTKGMNFVKTVDRICNIFNNIEDIENSIHMVVTKAKPGTDLDSINLSMKFILNAQKDNISEKSKKMVGFLLKNTQLFNEPKHVGDIDITHITKKILKTGKYFKTNNKKINISISDEATKYILKLTEISKETTIKIFNTILNASKNSNNFINNSKNVLVNNYKTIEELLPKELKLEKINVKGEKLNFANIKLLQDLYDVFKKENSDIKNIKDAQRIANKMITVFASYSSNKISEKVISYRYILDQQLEYISAFSKIIGSNINFKLDPIKKIFAESKKYIENNLKKSVIDMELKEDGDLKYYEQAVKILSLYKNKKCTKNKNFAYEKMGDVCSNNPKENKNTIRYYFLALQEIRESPQIYNKIGNLLFQIKEFELAIGFYKITKNTLAIKDCYKSLIKSNPNDYKIREQRGDTRLYLGDFSKAIRCYMNANSLTENKKIINDINKKILICQSEDYRKDFLKNYKDDIENGRLYKFENVPLDKLIKPALKKEFKYK